MTNEKRPASKNTADFSPIGLVRRSPKAVLAYVLTIVAVLIIIGVVCFIAMK